MSGAAQGRSNRNRGARAEVQVVNYLRSRGWPDARRYLAGDGRQPGDIDFHPLVTLEVRDRKGSAWPTWCRQAVAEAPAGTVPVVVRRTRGVTDVGEWECRYWIGGWRMAMGDENMALAPAEGLCRRIVDLPGGGSISWYSQPFASFVDALLAFDAADQAVTQ